MRTISKVVRRLRDRLVLKDSQYIQQLAPPLALLPINQTSMNDVFVAGYPKSGNTWMQNLLAGLVYGIDTQYLPDRLTQILVPDVQYQKYYTRFHEICFFKTHRLPMPEYRRVIFLVRDGRDIMASYHAYNKNRGEPSDLKKMIVQGEGLFPCRWHEYVHQWLENPYSAEILTVRYEDLLQDTHRELARICSFLPLERDDDLISRVVLGSTFKEMQRKERVFGMSNQQWPRDKQFARRGVMGGYMDEIPPDLVRYFENEAKTYLLHFGYELS